jgi:PilZ domain-containing protein
MTDAFTRTHSEFGGCDRQASRRSTVRVAGPFDARRVGPLPTPLRVHDLSTGGCLVECHYDLASGRRITLQIDLPGEGWITVEAETLYLRENFGFAVRFIELSDGNRGRIERTIERLLIGRSRSGRAGWNSGES